MTARTNRIVGLVLLMIACLIIGTYVNRALELANLIDSVPPVPVIDGETGEEVPLVTILERAAREQHSSVVVALSEMSQGLLWGVLYFLWGLAGGTISILRGLVGDERSKSVPPAGVVAGRVLLGGVAGVVALLVILAPEFVFTRVVGQSRPNGDLAHELQILAVTAGIFERSFFGKLNLFKEDA